ncbi:hypothetical protein CD039_00370 [Staphylococcus argensis]|uniref:Gram-positive cocci surface proteins LPxTG domain-containing protein n=1 Tax=Staphylococcus argensis TaxID=1607738 RepID=A0A2K4FG75_9STAP|nr:YSIRK-type signal peptide-containing protein [Staphylococcus argensis]POA10339.1 hypothetical protein CD039_00370 [Staphylococcus argensis]
MNNNQFTKKDRFGIRKFSVGVGSALLTSLLFLGISHSANAAEDEIELNLDNPEESTIPAATTPANNGNTASDGVDPYAPTSEHSAEIDNQDPNTITNTYDGKNEMDPTPGSQGTSPLEYDGNHEMTPTPGKQGTSPLEYDGSHEMTPTPGKQGTSPLEYDGSHEITPTPGDQSQSPLGDAQASDNTTEVPNGSSNATTNNQGKTVETDAQGNTIVTDAQGNTTVTDTQGNVVQDSTVNAMTNDDTMDAQGNTVEGQTHSEQGTTEGSKQGNQSKEDSKTGQLPETGGSDMTVPLATSTAMLVAGLGLLFRRKNVEK